jgi:hypothetical protein
MKVKLSEGTHDDGLGIPYPKRDGTTNVGYRDLKNEPATKADIHEITRYPELQQFIDAVNEPGFFRTIRWGDVEFGRVDISGGRDAVNSYMTIAFEILDLNRAKECYVDLYKRFVASAVDCTRCGNTFVEFKLIPTSYNAHGINRAWSTDVEIRGLGTTKTEARSNWALGWRTVQNFLVNESALWAAELRKGRVTIS